MEGSLESSRTLDDSTAIEVTGKIMVVAIIVLFLVVVFVLVLHVYAKWFWYRRGHDDLPTQRRRRLDLAAGHVQSSALPLGLDPSVLKSIPIIVFNPNEIKDGLECAVCLCEVTQGEKARLLPKCNHGFHVECIDMWFQSQSTCPICRNPVSIQSSSTSISPQSSSESSMEANLSVNGFSTESLNYPTNVLFWGNQTQVSTLGPCLEEENQAPNSSKPSCSSSSSSSMSNRPEGVLVIDIPRQINEEEEPKSPAMTRLKSFKRLLSLSRDRKVAHFSSSNVDVEQPGRSQS